MTTVNYAWQDAGDRDTMRLRVAGWSIELRVSPTALFAQLASRYAAFRAALAGTAAASPDLVVDVWNEFAGESGPAGPGAGAVNSESILQAHLTPAGGDLRLDSDHAYGMIGASRGRAALRLRSADPSPEVEYFLRVALALFALSRDGLLIHCAALKRSDSVYLFVGQSGSGKSTVVALSRAARAATALGDDLIVVRREGGAWRAHGTPFWNVQTADHEGELETGRLAHIYKLVQDRTVYVEPMGTAAATAELLANCPVVNGQPDLLQALMDRCREIAGAAGVGRLHFRKDDSFWSVVG